jgi:hypothetical protein
MAKLSPSGVFYHLLPERRKKKIPRSGIFLSYKYRSRAARAVVLTRLPVSAPFGAATE